MRYALVLAFFFFAQFAFGTPKDVTAIMKESQATREAASKEKDSNAKIKKLKDFESSLNATIKDYEKEAPIEGSEAEEKVVKFSYRFEPLFDLTNAKITKDSCAKTKGQIEKDDLTGKAEGSPLSENAKEALRWLEVLCK